MRTRLALSPLVLACLVAVACRGDAPADPLVGIYELDRPALHAALLAAASRLPEFDPASCGPGLQHIVEHTELAFELRPQGVAVLRGAELELATLLAMPTASPPRTAAAEQVASWRTRGDAVVVMTAQSTFECRTSGGALEFDLRDHGRSLPVRLRRRN